MATLPEIPCRVCGSRRSTFLCITHNEHSETSELLNFRCLDCGSVFIGNAIRPEELGVAYGSMDAAEYYREIDAQNSKKMESALRDLEGLIPRSAALLDVGTGNGRFVELARAAGYTDVSAHEIAGSDLSRIEGLARAIYQDFDYRSIPDGTFDCVTLLDVAEHVPDPEVLFRNCRRVLKDTGILYLHTPVVTPVDRMMHRVQRLPGVGKVGRVWQRARTSIFHLQNYTPRSIRLAMERAGFAEVKIEVVNELSWPVSRYVRSYVLEKQGLPTALTPLLVPVLYPFIATRFFNANKAVVTAR
jgi:SAM-dependent methyltransferase